jgi:hypothetical protein
MSNKWDNKTRGGYPVRIYAEDGGGICGVHGAMYKNDGWCATNWTHLGSYLSTGKDSAYDLLPIKKKKRVFKTLDELAMDYDFKVEGGIIHIEKRGCLLVTLLKGSTDVGLCDDEWNAIFTKEINEEG